MGKHDILPIPDAMVGEVLGLTEIIYSYRGKLKISFIADELQLEMDDLGDAIDMAELLGVAKVKRGCVYLTLFGEALAIGTIDNKKKILRKKIKSLEPFKTIIKIINKEKKVGESYLFKQLKKNFPIQNSKKFKKLLLSWGGYTEIFEYHGNKQLFTLPKEEFEPLD